ncbi:MAG: glycosyltransferase family protein [Hyphomicrobiales bacterium]
MGLANGAASLGQPGNVSRSGRRALFYSHDTFGLGHLRRTRAIANALVGAHPGLSVIIISGSPVIGSFEYGNGVDYVRVPGVVKQPDGDYSTMNLKVDLDDAVRLREAIIRETASTFSPDLLIVDKEPAGFRGELLPTLDMLKQRGARIVLGVRDVMDDPVLLRPEWERKGAAEALLRYYDDVVVYGLESVHEPLACLGLPQSVQQRIRYTGYLRRDLPQEPHLAEYPPVARGQFVLVTTGGGGDGDHLIDWVLTAYESAAPPSVPALICFGPFISREQQRNFMERIARLAHVDAIAFDAKIEYLMNRASAIVAMGGYNTFCEILSLDKPALIVPRARPRLEQTIRARRAAELGLVKVLEDPEETGAGRRDPAVMAKAIGDLLRSPRPSEAYVAGLLDGLDTIVEASEEWLTRRPMADAPDRRYGEVVA